jgi:putative addiction module component (TIGR02574 family)
MESQMLSQLLKLPAADRAELAMVLWESLTDDERAGEFELRDVQWAELDRRWAEHLENPASAIPWREARRKLLSRG